VICIQGESGPEKQFIAKSIHQKSKRSDFRICRNRLVVLFRKELAASELFGHIKGSLQVLLTQIREGITFELPMGDPIFIG